MKQNCISQSAFKNCFPKSIPFYRHQKPMHGNYSIPQWEIQHLGFIFQPGIIQTLMHYYFSYRTPAFLFPSPFFLLWFHVYQSTQDIHSIIDNSTSYKSSSEAGQIKAAGVGIVLSITRKSMQWEIRFQPNRRLLGWLYSSIWLPGYLYQLYSSMLYLCCRGGGNRSQSR